MGTNIADRREVDRKAPERHHPNIQVQLKGDRSEWEEDGKVAGESQREVLGGRNATDVWPEEEQRKFKI